MGATPGMWIHGDEILVNDMIGIGGTQYDVLSNTKERGEGFITLQLSANNPLTKETSYVELTVSVDSTFFVIRQ